MNGILEIFQQHPYSATAISTWLFNNIATAFVAAFAAPTKDSSVGYVWWFKFSNTVIGNLKRAQATAVENSPNFRDAVQKLNGGTRQEAP